MATAETVPPPTEDVALNEKAAALSVADNGTPVDSSNASTADPHIGQDASTEAQLGKPSESSKPFALEETEPKSQFKIPLAYPVASCKPTPAAELTEDQQKKYEAVLKAASEWTELRTAVAANASMSPITDDERMWLTRDCILRYLRATKWDQKYAITRLHNTLAWRREYGIDGLTPEYMGPENETGKQVIVGYDIQGRPTLYQDPSKQNTEESFRQQQHLPYLLERAIEIMPPGQETVALVINFKNSSRKTNPSMQMSKTVLSILQTHYPERLGRALISELPWYVNAFFKMISPFIDPVTRTKLRFNEPFSSNIPPAQLLKSWGGEADFVYDHESYWPALNAFAQHRRNAYRQRWVARGKKVGDDEWVLKGGEAKE